MPTVHFELKPSTSFSFGAQSTAATIPEILSQSQHADANTSSNRAKDEEVISTAAEAYVPELVGDNDHHDEPITRTGTIHFGLKKLAFFMSLIIFSGDQNVISPLGLLQSRQRI